MARTPAQLYRCVITVDAGGGVTRRYEAVYPSRVKSISQQGFSKARAAGHPAAVMVDVPADMILTSSAPDPGTDLRRLLAITLPPAVLQRLAPGDPLRVHTSPAPELPASADAPPSRERYQAAPMDELDAEVLAILEHAKKINDSAEEHLPKPPKVVIVKGSKSEQTEA